MLCLRQGLAIHMIFLQTISYIILILAVSVEAKRKANACSKTESMETGMKIAADFVDYFNTGELGLIFKKLMKQGATLTSVSAYPECSQVTTNMRTTLIEQYQSGIRIEGINKSTFWSAKDGSVIVNMAHMTGKMGLNPALIDVKLYLQAEEGCDFKIQSMSQTPYGCIPNQ
jgi:hypothetical protein